MYKMTQSHRHYVVDRGVGVVDLTHTIYKYTNQGIEEENKETYPNGQSKACGHGPLQAGELKPSFAP